MIDFDKIKDKVIQNKIKISNENINVDYKPIFFFLQNDEIVYIGKTDKKISEYILSKSKKFDCTHYFKELVNANEIDNIMAELVLTIHPSFNSFIPKNTKYITHTKAKESYHIEKDEFQKYWEENGKLKFRKTLFLEKKVFDDIFAIPMPYHKFMPKVGTEINDIKDIDNAPISDVWIQECLKEKKDGKFIESIISYKKDVPIEERYKNFQIRLERIYVVTKILNENVFEAYSEYKNITKKFIADSDGWEEFFYYRFY